MRSDRIGCLIIVVAFLVAIMFVVAANAHDHARPDLTPWLKSLFAKNKTHCCDGNDTDAIEDWETSGNHYRNGSMFPTMRLWMVRTRATMRCSG